MERRVKSLDGLRGVAVGLVLLHHFFAVPGGWAGVDIFFVLSGYLITSILRAERSESNFWQIFYVRRAARILPVYLLVILLVVLSRQYDWHVLWPYYTFFGANIATYRYGEAIGPLTVLWSLAVEEHFYFIWPMNVRRFTDRTLAWILGSIMVLEPLIRVGAQQIHPMHWTAIYNLTPFRLDGLAAGSLMSVLLTSQHARSVMDRFLGKALLLALCCGALAFGLFRQTRMGNPLFFNLFGYSALAITSALLLAYLVLRKNTFAARGFSVLPLLFLGRISYALYMFHPFVQDVCWHYAKLRGYTHHDRVSLISMPLSLLLAWISTEFFERRFLDMARRKVGRYRTLSAPVVTSA